MARFLLVFVSLFFFVISNAQFVVPNGFHISKVITDATIGRTDRLGAWEIKGGFDINNNGKKEIIIFADPVESGGSTDDTTASVYLLENDGNDNYKLIWSYHTQYPQNSFGTVEVADMDKDGKSEIWISYPAVVSENNPNPPRLLCFEFNGTEIPTTPTAEWNFGVPDNFDIRPIVIRFDDVDKDGDVELVAASRMDDYRGKGKGRTLIVASLPMPIEQNGFHVFQTELIDTSAYLTGGGIYDMKILDYDGDGKKEIWVFTWDMYTANVFEATAPNVYSHEVEIRQATSPEDIGSCNGTQFYDINGDGKLEALIAGATSGIGKIYFMESTTDVSKLTTSNIKLVGYNRGGDPRGAAIGDFNKNGKADFAFVDKFYNSVMMMEYKGSGNMADSTSYDWKEIFKDTTKTVPSRYYNMTSALSDMDGDGYVELLIANLNLMEDGRPMGIVLEATPLTAVQKLDSKIPTGFSLEQNYPNPFNPSTKINFSVPKTSLVNIKVYNMLGQTVSDLLNEVKDAGSYSVNFNASNLPSGSYYYKISAGDYSEVKKMMLMK